MNCGTVIYSLDYYRIFKKGKIDPHVWHKMAPRVHTLENKVWCGLKVILVSVGSVPSNATIMGWKYLGKIMSMLNMYWIFPSYSPKQPNKDFLSIYIYLVLWIVRGVFKKGIEWVYLNTAPFYVKFLNTAGLRRNHWICIYSSGLSVDSFPRNHGNTFWKGKLWNWDMGKGCCFPFSLLDTL